MDAPALTSLTATPSSVRLRQLADCTDNSASIINNSGGALDHPHARTSKASNPVDYEETQKRWINVLVFCHAAFADILRKYAPAQSDLVVVAFAGLAYTALLHVLVFMFMHSSALHRIVIAGGLGSHLISFIVTIIPLLWVAASFIVLFAAEEDTFKTKRLFEGLFGMITTTILGILAIIGWNMWKKDAVGGVERSRREEAPSDNDPLASLTRRDASVMA